MPGRDILSDDYQPSATGGRDILADLAPTPEQQRAERLRKIARTAMDFGDGAPNAGDLFSDAFTLGLMKPTAGLATGLGNLVTGKSGFGEGYAAGTGAYQERLDEASENAGWGGTVADVAGSLTAGGPARGVIQQGIWPTIRQAAGLGAVEGAARNAEDPMSAASGAATGGVVAGGTAGTVSGLLDWLLPAARTRRTAERERAQGTPPDELRTQARSLYRQLDDAGVAYDPTQSTTLADTLRSDLVQAGWDPQGVHSTLNGVIERVEGLRGQPMSLETLQQIREQVSSNAGSNEPQVRRIAGRINSVIDGFVSNVQPAMSSIPADQVSGLWSQARRLWRTASLADDIGWRVRKAERRAASTNSGQNTENAIRQNIRQAVDKAEQPGRFNPWSAEELTQMNRVVEGTTPQNALRWTGNLVSGIPAQSIMGGTTAGLTGLGLATGGADMVDALLAGGAGLTASGATQGLGHMLKNQGSKIAQNEADTLMRLVSTGSAAPPPPVQGPPTREALAWLLRQQQAARGAGLIAGGGAAQ